ncbi:MAG: hypothetical protein LBG57_08240 [Treponema sp.]|nr:hypothetical protein [Treponema sp.]
MLSIFLLGNFPAFARENGPPVTASARWFRSNAGGMTLEEVSSRAAALHNEYALLIDYARTGDLPETLSPFYRSEYLIEIHALFTRGEESRRQWIFRDNRGVARLVSVLNRDSKSEPAVKEPAPAPEESSAVEESGEEISGSDEPTGRAPWGFIEIYNENYRITEEYMFNDDGGETVIAYSYRGGLLVKAEGRRKKPPEEGIEDGEFIKTFTDDYRYNRSLSLRSINRLFHEDIEVIPVSLTFPNRVLDLAAQDDFSDEKLAVNSEFFGEFDVRPGYRMVFTTDERGRILTQTLLDDSDNVVWLIQNTWSDNRISSALKTEGDDKLLAEYEYDGRGDRIVERNFRNGVLERMVYAEDGRDVEELYMNGVVVLRAEWEDGRKISEKRIRRSM